ncbi:MAG: hypothetical protein AB7E09_08325 [Candidatus Izemoplasmatales bacterium]
MKKLLMSLSILVLMFVLISCSQDPTESSQYSTEDITLSSFQVVQERFFDAGYTLVEEDNFIDEENSTQADYSLEQWQAYGAVKVYVVYDSNGIAKAVIIDFETQTKAEEFVLSMFGTLGDIDDGFKGSDLIYDYYLVYPLDKWTEVINAFQGQ